MEQSPSWEANRFSASQEIPQILWNPKIITTFTSDTNCPYPEPAWSSPSPTSHFPKIHLNIILPSMPGSPKWCYIILANQNSFQYLSSLSIPGAKSLLSKWFLHYEPVSVSSVSASCSTLYNLSNKYSKTPILHFCADHSNGVTSKKVKNLGSRFYKQLPGAIQKAHKIIENTKCGT